MKTKHEYRKKFALWRKRRSRSRCILNGIELRTEAIQECSQYLKGAGTKKVREFERMVLENPRADMVLTISLIIIRRFSVSQLRTILPVVYAGELPIEFNWSCYSEEGLMWFTDRLGWITISEMKKSFRAGKIIDTRLKTFFAIFLDHNFPFVTKKYILSQMVRNGNDGLLKVFSYLAQGNHVPELVAEWFDYHLCNKGNRPLIHY